MNNKNNPTFKPGSLSYYLRAAGWEVVPQKEGFPLWRKSKLKPVTGSKALLEVYREIWRNTKGLAVKAGVASTGESNLQS